MNVNNIEIEKVTEEKAAASEAVKDEGMTKVEVCAKCGKPFKTSRRDIDILTGEVFHPECIEIGGLQ